MIGQAETATNEPTHFETVMMQVHEGLTAKGINPSGIAQESYELLYAFAKSKGLSVVLGETLYVTGMMPRVGGLLDDPKVIGDLVEMWEVIHPGMSEKLSSRSGLDKTDHVRGVILTGCSNYLDELKGLRESLKNQYPEVDVDARIMEVTQLVLPLALRFNVDSPPVFQAG